MASHVRKINGNAAERRVQIKFSRPDLLWIGKVTDPVTHDVYDVPLQGCGVALVGPTILDMLHRRERTVMVDGEETLEGFWSVRVQASLFPTKAQRETLRQKPRNLAGGPTKLFLDHPFLARFASGGAADTTVPSQEGFVRVRKLTTITIGEYAFRLAARAFGSPAAARSRFARVARDCWEADLRNSARIWEIVSSHPGPAIAEDAVLAALRPAMSVSQDVERMVMREAFRLLGIDPDLDIGSPRGRPTKAPGDEGDIISVKLVDQGDDRIAVGSFKKAYRGIEVGTPLSAVPDSRLVAILGALRLEGLADDADMLEAYLDAASPSWRDEAAGEAVGEAPGIASFDPWEVLGIAKGASMADVKRAKNAMMKLVHLETNLSEDGTWRPGSLLATLVNDAYVRIKSEMGGSAHE